VPEPDPVEAARERAVAAHDRAETANRWAAEALMLAEHETDPVARGRLEREARDAAAAAALHVDAAALQHEHVRHLQELAKRRERGAGG
jgi:hypothetical protein